MDVSVVIPAKDEEDNIGRVLTRLTEQIDPGDEIFVLNNESTDLTAPIAEGFDQVRVIWMPDDAVEQTRHYRGNLDGIRQRGAEMANNEIIVSTDADTIPPRDWIDRIKAHFEEDPDLDLVWGVPVDINGVPVRNMESKFANLFGAISGCNTAFRKSTFEQLDRGYVGWPMYEDMTIVTRIARVGKVKHDSDLKMPTDMDRTRFQTYPMLTAGAVGGVGGALVGGPIGAAAAGTGLGLALTESFYESAPSTRFHHDQIGLLMVAGGILFGGTFGWGAAGAGTGIVAHHLLTEGISAIPTNLMENTDRVCRVSDADDDVIVIECETPDDDTASVTRLAGGLVAGAVAGKLIQLAQA